MILPDGPPGQLLEAIRARRLKPVASWDLAEEIAEVLRRPKLRRYEISEGDIEDVLLLLAPFLPDVEVPAELGPSDLQDLPVISAALAGKAQFIVTGDTHLTEDAKLRRALESRQIKVLTPAQALEMLRVLTNDSF